jgi:hypothetical protein
MFCSAANVADVKAAATVLVPVLEDYSRRENILVD